MHIFRRVANELYNESPDQVVTMWDLYKLFDRLANEVEMQDAIEEEQKT